MLTRRFCILLSIREGIPAAIILSPENKIIYPMHASELATTRSIK